MPSLHRWLAVIAIVVFVTLAWWTYYLVHTSLEAERTLQAYRAVLDQLTVYLKKNHAWPKDWQALCDSDPNGYNFSDHSKGVKIRARVAINFNATAKDIANMRPDEFTAVVPLGPNFGPDDLRIQAVIDAAREATAHGGEGQSGDQLDRNDTSMRATQPFNALCRSAQPFLPWLPGQ